MKINKLKLNENKTKLMKINMHAIVHLELISAVIENVNSIKYLGFIIDSDLKLKEHLDSTCRKIWKKFL